MPLNSNKNLSVMLVVKHFNPLYLKITLKQDEILLLIWAYSVFIYILHLIWFTFGLNDYIHSYYLIYILFWSPCTSDFRGFYILHPLYSKGLARTQIPTNTNYAIEFPTFGEIAGVNPTDVQWKGLTLEEPPSWSWLTS